MALMRLGLLELRGSSSALSPFSLVYSYVLSTLLLSHSSFYCMISSDVVPFRLRS
jgi:hypothetical protein